MGPVTRARFRQQKAQTIRYLLNGSGNPRYHTLEALCNALNNGDEFFWPRGAIQPASEHQPYNGYDELFSQPQEFSRSLKKRMPNLLRSRTLPFLRARVVTLVRNYLCSLILFRVSCLTAVAVSP